MTYETINDVPQPLLPYYTEEVRSELTGEQVEESYTYQDEEGVEQTATRLVDEYADVTYVVEIERKYTMSESTMLANIEHNSLRASQGDLHAQITLDNAIQFYLNSLEYDSVDYYKEWLACEPSRDDDVFALEDGEFNQSLYDESLALWAANEKSIVVLDLAQWKLDNYSMLRRYPDDSDYKDGLVKGDNAQMQKYIDECNAVKAYFAKPST